jgi:Platelet-activating factor acetylhydrolase, isoform II
MTNIVSLVFDSNNILAQFIKRSIIMLQKSVLWSLFRIITITLILMNRLFTASAADNPVPAPTGPYKIGVEWRHWVDESRDETFDEAPHGKREMMIEFLYPADDATTGDTAGYPENPEILASFSNLMTQMNLNLDFPLAEFADFQSYAYPNAALSEDQARYPVLIFSHGAAADVTMYTAQIEELASHGYVMVAINHAYGGSATVFPDGRVVTGNFATGLEAHVPIWAQDQMFVIDQLEQLNANDPENRFTGRLDPERLGVFGQSLGGSAATVTCSLDSRCKAGAAGDSPIYGEVIENGLDQPFLYMLSVSRIFSNPEFFANARGPYYEADFAGFEHLDFGDFTFWPNVTPLHDALWLGSVEPARAVELTRAYLVAFFDKYVKGTGGELLDAPTNPEVTLTTRNLN